MDIDEALTTTDAHRRWVRRNWGLVVAVAATSVAAVIGVTASTGGQDPVKPAPIEQPNQKEQPNQPDSQGIFADIHGWIVNDNACCTSAYAVSHVNHRWRQRQFRQC